MLVGTFKNEGMDKWGAVGREGGMGEGLWGGCVRDDGEDV